MKVKFELYPLPLPDPAEEQQYYPRIIGGRTVTTNEIAHNISRSNSLTDADIKGALSALAHEIERNLCSGNNVYLEGIGYFNLAVKGPRITNPVKVRSNQVEFKSVNFRADKDLKSKFANIEFTHEKSNKNDKTYSYKKIEEIVISYLNKNQFITRSKLQQLCGISITTACRHLKRLEEKDVVKNINTKRSPFYVKGGDGKYNI